MRPPIADEHDEPDPVLLRRAVLREAARLAGARDVVLVAARPPTGAALVEALVCHDHWTGAVELDLAREPLLASALATGRVGHCCPRRPRRICGPFWAASATLVPVHEGRAGVVVLAGAARPVGDGRAREAAATVAALLEGDAAAPQGAGRPATLAGWPAPRYGVVVVRAAGLWRDATARTRVAAAVRSAVPTGAFVRRADGDELCVLIPDANPSTCDAAAAAARAALARAPDGPPSPCASGWALEEPGRPVAECIRVAQAMAEHEARGGRPEPVV